MRISWLKFLGRHACLALTLALPATSFGHEFGHRGGQCDCPSACTDGCAPGSATATDGATDAESQPLTEDDLAFDSESGAYAGESFASNVGYIDTAWVRTQFRFRFDENRNLQSPDRAEFYYSAPAQFGGLVGGAIGENTSVNMQVYDFYFEHAFTCRFSAFIDVPFNAVQPSGIPGPGDSQSGIGDLIAGFKYAIQDDFDRKLTFQLKNYCPTGDPELWLGTGHYSIEPGLLFFQRLGDRWMLEAQLRDWIPVGGTVNPNNGEDFAGNVLIYGLGLSYALIDNGDFQVSPVVEAVGWSVLGGQKTVFDAANVASAVNASGDTIINLKAGVRVGNYAGHSFYAGYGRCLTGDTWYDEIFRLEYRKMF